MEYIFFHREGDPSPKDIEDLKSIPELTILDDKISRALLVIAPDEVINKVQTMFPGWTVGRMKVHPKPGDK